MQLTKVGLALGGGGARGWAHIGVLRALEEADIKIDYLAGTSVGALIGGVYATGALNQLENFANEITVDNLLPLIDVSFPNLGLIEGKQVYSFIMEYLADKNIEDANIPFRCVATNFLLKKEVVFRSGNMVDAIRASISIPGIFVPFKQGDVYLVDGGVVNPVPVSVVEDMGAEIVIAVNLNKEPKTEKASSSCESNKSESNTQEEQMDETSQKVQEQQQSESGIVQNLKERYETFKNILDDCEDKIDDWLPDAKTGLNVFDVIGNSINMMEQQVTQVNMMEYPPDLLIEPDLRDCGIFDFHEAQSTIKKGYDAAKAAIPEIRQKLEASN